MDNKSKHKPAYGSTFKGKGGKWLILLPLYIAMLLLFFIPRILDKSLGIYGYLSLFIITLMFALLARDEFYSRFD